MALVGAGAALPPGPAPARRWSERSRRTATAATSGSCCGGAGRASAATCSGSSSTARCRPSSRRAPSAGWWPCGWPGPCWSRRRASRWSRSCRRRGTGPSPPRARCSQRLTWPRWPRSCSRAARSCFRGAWRGTTGPGSCGTSPPAGPCSCRILPPPGRAARPRPPPRRAAPVVPLNARPSYDEDSNHEPCCRQGHKAHWAVVSGALLGARSPALSPGCREDAEIPGLFHPGPGPPRLPPDDELAEVFLLAKQGKSRRVQLWGYGRLHESNAQLTDFSPRRTGDGKVYVVPAGGVRAGLCGKAVLLQPPAPGV